MNQVPGLIFVVGPTAVGKSEIAFELARKLSTEIVSCDALQVYKEIAIASDKPSRQALAQIPHHLIDVVSVTEEFNVARFRQLAVEAISQIQARAKTPLITGGSGMYMTVLLDGIFAQIEVDEDLKEELSQELLVQGPAVLHDRLKILDPAAAAKIHPNDPQRILRALAVTLSTGQPISQLQSRREGLWGNMPVKIFGLNRPREELYRRAEARIERMFATGLVDEIKSILNFPLSRTAQKIIGIPELAGYFKGEYDLQRAKYLMELNTRHYVKRQLTWFRREKRLNWLDIGEQSPSQIVKIIARGV